MTLQCQLQPAPCGRQLLNCHLLEQQGDVLILDLVRLGQYGTVGVGSTYIRSINVVRLDFNPLYISVPLWAVPPLPDFDPAGHGDLPRGGAPGWGSSLEEQESGGSPCAGARPLVDISAPEPSLVAGNQGKSVAISSPKSRIHPILELQNVRKPEIPNLKLS